MKCDNVVVFGSMAIPCNLELGHEGAHGGNEPINIENTKFFQIMRDIAKNPDPKTPIILQTHAKTLEN
jgi:hypothetical protein